MDKSFNEDELADIMSEIESLENGSDEDIEMSMDSIDEEEELEDYEVHSLPKRKSVNQSSAPHSEMSFHIEGQMSLSLGFTISGKEVQIKVSEEGMKIIMDNGAEFHLPVNDEFKNVA